MNWNWIWTGLGVMAMCIMVFMLFRILDPNAIDELREQWQVEAKYQLSYVCNLQENYFEEKGTYARTLDDLGFFQAEDSKADFWIEMTDADSSNFLARAYAMLDFDNDGALNVWEIQKECQPREIVED